MSNIVVSDTEVKTPREPRTLFWFHHMHKCAGTLVVRTAASAGLRFWPENNNGNPTDLVKRLPLERYNARQLNEFVSECLNRGVDFVATEFGSPDFSVLADDPRVNLFTVLREPYSRFRSSYLFVVNCGYHPVLTMNGFLESGEFDATHNFYIKSLARRQSICADAVTGAISILNRFDRVFIQESTSLAADVAQYLGSNSPLPTRVNAGSGRDWRMLLGRARRGDLYRAVAGIIARRTDDQRFRREFVDANQADLELYQTTVNNQKCRVFLDEN